MRAASSRTAQSAQNIFIPRTDQLRLGVR